jgi:hypothetical protein
MSTSNGQTNIWYKVKSKKEKKDKKKAKKKAEPKDAVVKVDAIINPKQKVVDNDWYTLTSGKKGRTFKPEKKKERNGCVDHVIEAPDPVVIMWVLREITHAGNVRI